MAPITQRAKKKAERKAQEKAQREAALAAASQPAVAPGWPQGAGNLSQPTLPPEVANRSGLRTFAGGTPAYTTQFPIYTQGQGEAFSSILQQALGQLGQFGQPSQAFQPIANQAREQFATQTIPSIAERFTSLGGGGGKSSAFGQQLGSAGAQLESNLGAQGAAFGLDQNKLLLALMSLGLTPQFESAYTPRQPGFFENLLGGLFKAGPTAAATYLGGRGQ